MGVRHPSDTHLTPKGGSKKLARRLTRNPQRSKNLPRPFDLLEIAPNPGFMDKLVERETATRNPLVAAPALAVQFFLIPLAVVAITVGVYVGFRSLLADSPLAPELVRAFEASKGDPQVRRYLALAIGRMDPPLPAEAVADLTRALD